MKLNKPEDFFNYGNSLRNGGNLNEASINFQRAIKLNSNYYEAYNNLGVVLVNLGKLADAIYNFEKAISIFPNYSKAYFNLSNSITFKENNLQIKKMEEIFSKNETKVDSKIDLAFSLGKAYEDLKLYEKAFEYWELGNNYLRNTYKYSIDEDKVFFENLKLSFNKSTFESLKIKDSDDSTPIFIIGLPRSGTTLVEQVLSNHSEVYGGGEIPLLQNLITKHFLIQKDSKAKDEKKYLEENFKIISSTYISKVKEKAHNKKRITDKFPYNFKWIGLIKILFPKAKVIHCKRNLQDNCLSLFKTKFVNINENKWSCSLEEIINYYAIIYYYSHLLDCSGGGHFRTKKLFENFQKTSGKTSGCLKSENFGHFAIVFGKFFCPKMTPP